ncbi:hypothetical protein SteCoe_18402 [Stentor coeruleus]|uniref:Major facilitator superfamily (MFS) profile domain-containing protein n=1 Tax=Stentor coeruleus TaxID=5963 RepID=A0A1R2BWK8_9CILI|nr:hypothetical protein SteCoe_18402 [Stentor coeruleus]
MHDRIKVFSLYLGAILINTVFYIQIAGLINGWGSISPYIASYYHHLDSSIYTADFVIVNSYSYTFEAGLTVITAYLIKFFQPFWIIVMGTLISLTGFFLSSYITNPYLFCWVIGFSFGAMSAFIFFPSVWIVWNQNPKNKAFSSGMSLSGYSLGPVILGMLFTFIANPYDYQAETIERNGKEDEKIFGKFVADRVPMTIRWCTFTFLIIFLVSAMLLKRKWRTDNSEKNISQTTMTYIEMLKNLKFWNLFFISVFGLSSFGYVINIYKIIGLNTVKDDHFISIVGALGSFFQCFGRIFFGIILDKYPWKRIMSIDFIIITICFLTLELSEQSKYLYAFFIITLYFLITAIYNGIIIQTDRDFPHDRWIITYVFLGMIPAFFVPFFLEKYLTPIIGYFWTFVVISGITMVATFQVIFHQANEVVIEKELAENLNIDEEKTNK